MITPQFFLDRCTQIFEKTPSFALFNSEPKRIPALRGIRCPLLSSSHKAGRFVRIGHSSRLKPETENPND